MSGGEVSPGAARLRSAGEALRSRLAAALARAPRPSRDGKIARSFWSLIDQGVVSGGTFVGVLALARNLTPDDYGVFALLFGAMLGLQLFNATLIHHPLAVRLPVAPLADRTALVLRAVALAAALTLALCVPFAIGLALLGVAELILPSVACFALWQVQEAFRRGLLCQFRHREAVVGDAARYVGQGAAIVALAALGVLTLAAALWAMAAFSAVAALIQARQIGLRGGLAALDRAELRAMARDYWSIGGVWTLGSGLLEHARLTLAPIVLAIVYDPAAAAGFQAAMNLINLLNPITISIGNLAPQAASQKRAEGLAPALRAVGGYAAIGLAPILAYAALAFAAPGAILELFYGAGSPYVGLAAAVRLLMVVTLVAYASDVFVAYLCGVVEIRSAFLVNFIGTAALTVAIVPLVVWFGLIGGCLAILLANIVRIGVSLWVARRLFAPGLAAGGGFGARDAAAASGS